MMMNKTQLAEVLYDDYNGHTRPLSRMYFSMDSGCLVADHPESVQEEVESHFCPHCNSLWHAEEAQSNGNRYVLHFMLTVVWRDPLHVRCRLHHRRMPHYTSQDSDQRRDCEICRVSRYQRKYHRAIPCLNRLTTHSHDIPR